MFGKKKAIHVITAPAQPGSIAAALGDPTESATVYGRRDLKTRKAAAKAAGVKLTVRKLKRDET